MAAASRTSRVLAYWFGSECPPLDRAIDGARLGLWFGASADADREIRELFTGDLDDLSRQPFCQEAATSAAPSAALPAEIATGNDALAAIVVLDQFSRHIHRDDPRAFATDAAALALARAAVARGWNGDAALRHPVMRAFMYLPFMHAEDGAAQHEGTALYEAALAGEPQESPFRGLLAKNVAYMAEHAAIIAAFGRFPHRNGLLGRPSTDDERAFLAAGGATFDPRPQK